MAEAWRDRDIFLHVYPELGRGSGTQGVIIEGSRRWDLQVLISYKQGDKRNLGSMLFPRGMFVKLARKVRLGQALANMFCKMLESRYFLCSVACMSVMITQFCSIV